MLAKRYKQGVELTRSIILFEALDCLAYMIPQSGPRL